MNKAEIKAYQKILKEVNLYDGEIDGIIGPKTEKASNIYSELSDKGYTKSQIFRHTTGAPLIPDEHWPLFAKHGKDYKQHIPIEDSIIDSLKKMK